MNCKVLTFKQKRIQTAKKMACNQDINVRHIIESNISLHDNGLRVGSDHPDDAIIQRQIKCSENQILGIEVR